MVVPAAIGGKVSVETIEIQHEGDLYVKSCVRTVHVQPSMLKVVHGSMRLSIVFVLLYASTKRYG